MRNEAICCSSVLSTTPLLSATLDIRKTIVRDAEDSKMLLEMVEMTEGRRRDEEKVEGCQKAGDEEVQRRTKERRGVE